MPKPVALILLNWNTRRHTANCISSIIKHCCPAHYDLIIADNGSTDGSLAHLKSQFPKHTYIDNQENLGFAGGNNRALDYCINQGYPYSLLINTDTEVTEDFIAPLLQHLQQHPEVAAVQPAIYFLNNKDCLWNGGSFYNPVFGITYAKNKKSRQALQRFETVDWLTGCCMLLRNDLLQKTGLFNERYFLYFEDVELSFRLRARGYALHYFPGTKIYHEAGVSGKHSTDHGEGILSPVIHYYLSRNKIWFLRQYSNPLSAPFIVLYHTIYFAALLVYFFLRGRRQKTACLIKGIKEGLWTPKKEIGS